MELHAIGYHHPHEKPFWIDRPNGVQDWLFLIIKTKSQHIIDGKEVCYPANSFVLYTPFHPQIYGSSQNEYIDDWMHFCPSPAELEMIQKMNIPLNTVIPTSGVGQISQFVRNMCYEFYSANQNRWKSIDQYFSLILFKLDECVNAINIVGNISESKHFEKLIWIREQIYRFPERNWYVDDLASDLKISRSRFQHLYTDSFGISLSKDVLTSRMKKAGELLICSEMAIHEIAFQVGFDNNSYFNRQFKNTYGVTPLSFREQHKI